MIFGVYGTHGTGKTTWLETVDVPGVRKVYGDLITVNIDNIPMFPKSHYYRNKDGKLELLTYLINDNRTLWVVEGTRFWGSMLHHIRPIIDQAGGGFFMLTIYTTADIMRKALIDRAPLNNKEYREDYWTPQKLEYESRKRMENACTKHLDPDDWMSVEFHGDYSAWTSIADQLVVEFAQHPEYWYERRPTVYLDERRPMT